MPLNSQGDVGGGIYADETGLEKSTQMFLFAAVRAEGARLVDDCYKRATNHLLVDHEPGASRPAELNP